MSNEQCISANILHIFSAVHAAHINALLSKELAQLNKKIVVLNDDPAGVQAVHGISVYINWREYTMLRGLSEQNSMFFVLTNTRGCTVAQTTIAHAQMVRSIAHAMRQRGKDSIITPMYRFFLDASALL